MFDKIVDIVCIKSGRQPDEIKEETTLTDLGMDSLDAVDLLMTIEEEFDTEIPEDVEFNAVGDIVNWLKEAKK